MANQNLLDEILFYMKHENEDSKRIGRDPKNISQLVDTIKKEWSEYLEHYGKENCENMFENLRSVPHYPHEELYTAEEIGWMENLAFH